jgi:hypothetical protein
MLSSDRRGIIDRIVGACLSVLVGAVAVYISVKLIEAVSIAIFVIIGVFVLVGIVVAILRARSHGW